jgi:hypothetical protein
MVGAARTPRKGDSHLQNHSNCRFSLLIQLPPDHQATYSPKYTNEQTCRPTTKSNLFPIPPPSLRPLPRRSVSAAERATASVESRTTVPLRSIQSAASYVLTRRPISLTLGQSSLSTLARPLPDSRRAAVMAPPVGKVAGSIRTEVGWMGRSW